jgi:WhiB family redox-sensing transcriptional regulator
MSDALDWRARGRCVGVDPNIFFIERGESSESAKTLCAECPVRTECLHFALSTNQMHGIWGGKSERQRRVLRQSIQGRRSISLRQFSKLGG